MLRQEQLDEMWRRGCRFWEQDKIDEALLEFKSIVEASPSHLGALIKTGYILLKLNNTEMALDYFQRAAIVSPAAELVSRGLFLSLALLGRDAEAWEESERFLGLSVQPWPDYELMLKEARGEISAEEFDEIAKQIDRTHQR